jgi:hypothetical protein
MGTNPGISRASPAIRKAHNACSEAQSDARRITHDSICKQEVTGSIPVGSIGRKPCKSAGFWSEAALGYGQFWAESTAGEYRIGGSLCRGSWLTPGSAETTPLDPISAHRSGRKAPERIDWVVRSGLREPPVIEVYESDSQEQPGVLSPS